MKRILLAGLLAAGSAVGAYAQTDPAASGTSATKLSDDRTRVSVSLPGLLPRGEYAWGVYEGSCTGTIMGAESAYPHIVPDANSMGSFTAMVDANFVPGGNYYVTLFTNGGQRTEVLGCVPLEQGVDTEPEE